MLLTALRTDLAPSAFIAQCGEVFAVFNRATQDSGNVSYGVHAGPERWFVKTAGSPGEPAFLEHGDRVELLRSAVRLSRSVSDPSMPALRNVIESPEGPLLVYEWVDGELLGTPADRRSDPDSAYARFRSLPPGERAAALDVVFRLHVTLAAAGWIASDFYDGCLLYDFPRRTMHVVDLDNYRDAPFTNQMGRMFGSTRFMAPEEFQLGARVDERTTVFAMGRTVEQFLPAGEGIPKSLDDLRTRACREDRDARFATVADFYRVWSRGQGSRWRLDGDC